MGDFSGIDQNAQNKLVDILLKINQSNDEQKQSVLRDELKMIANNQTNLMKQAQTMLQKWEEGDSEVIDLWSKMNGWVY